MGLTIQQYPLGELAADVYARIANSPLSCMKVTVQSQEVESPVMTDNAQGEVPKVGYAINYTVKLYKNAQSTTTIIPTAYEQHQVITDTVDGVNLYALAYSDLKAKLTKSSLVWAEE